MNVPDAGTKVFAENRSPAMERLMTEPCQTTSAPRISVARDVLPVAATCMALADWPKAAEVTAAADRLRNSLRVILLTCGILDCE